MDKKFVLQSYGRQSISDDDISAVVDALKSDFLTTGPLVEKFEDSLANFFDNKNVVVCNNGTSALFMAARVLGICDRDVVIVPSQTFLATASAPHLLGAEVVFSDVDPKTGLMRPEDLANSIKIAGQRFPSRRLRAIFVVHMNGQTAYMPDIWKLAQEHDCYLIEDACHALGAKTKFDPESASVRVGKCNFSDASTFSFHPVKNITTGEGGAIAFREPKHATMARLQRNHGINKSDIDGLDDALQPVFSWSHAFREPSLNFRLPDILCALGVSQLQKLENWVNKRAQLWNLYQCLFDDKDHLKLVRKEDWCEPAWHLCAVQLDFEELHTSRINVFKSLDKIGISPQVHYQPVHLQPYWIDRYGRYELPNSESYFYKTMSLPLHVEMSVTDVEYVVENLINAVRV